MKVKKFIAVFLAVASMATICASLVGCVGDKEKETDESTESISTSTGEVIAGGMQVGDTEENGIHLLSAALAPAEYSDYGVSAVAETAVTINATVNPAGAAEQGIDWSIAWTNPASSWATGKNVNDYVSFSAMGKQATVACLQPFGQQITVTATSKDNSDIKATCVLDYAQKVTLATLNIGNIPVNFNGTTEIQYEIASSVTGKGGTISANVTTSDVYTIAENFTKTVTFDMGDDSNAWFHINDKCPSGMAMADNDVTNWHGKSLYFDYDHDICNWVIIQRNGDLKFSSLSTSEIAEYFSNITVSYIATITLTLQGKHNTYTYTSDLVCTGFTNNTPVKSLTLDTSSYVF